MKDSKFVVVQQGSGVHLIPAIIHGEGVRITVDCRERFDDPKPLACRIAGNLNGLTTDAFLAILAAMRKDGNGLTHTQEHAIADAIGLEI